MSHMSTFVGSIQACLSRALHANVLLVAGLIADGQRGAIRGAVSAAQQVPGAHSGAADRVRADRFPAGRRPVQRRAAAIRRGGSLRGRRFGHAADEQPAAKRQGRGTKLEIRGYFTGCRVLGWLRPSTPHFPLLLPVFSSLSPLRLADDAGSCSHYFCRSHHPFPH